MATTTNKEIKGNVVSYDSGKYQLIVEWKGGKHGGFKFRPRVVVKDGFKKEHSAVFKWTDHTKNAIKEGSKSNDDTTIFKSTQKTVTYKKSVKSKGSKYAVTSKDKKGVSHGKWFTNYDGRVTISCTIGSGKSSVTIDHRSKPFAPEGITVNKVNAVDEHMRITVKQVKAKRYAPVRTLQLYRLADSGTESSYTLVTSKTFGNADSGGDVNGITNIVFDDIGNTQTGHRYKYKVRAVNAVGHSEQATDWYWTGPPEVTNVSHSRIAYAGEKENSVRFTREDSYIDHSYYKGFVLQYSNSLPSDPDSKQTWTTIPMSDITFYDPLYPSIPMSRTTQNFTWMSTKRKNSIGQTVDVGNNILLRHTACKKDLPYRYRILAYNYFEGGRKIKSAKKATGGSFAKGNNTSSGTDLTSKSKQGVLQKGDFGEPAVWTDDPAPSISGTDVTYNEPYEPKEVAATYKPSDGTVELVITRQQIKTTADLMFIQRKADGDWEDVPANGGSDGIPITPKTDPNQPDYDNMQYTYTDDEVPQGSTNPIIYRVALACSNTPAEGTTLQTGNGKSDWKESNEVITVSQPNAPTLTMPVNNGYALIEDGTVRFAWIHSPNDGTAQEAAVLSYSTDNETWTDIQIADVSYYDLDISEFQSGDTVSWKVKTKGTHPDYSDYSDPFTLKIYVRPSITWTSPANGSEISNLPLALEWIYSDDNGTLEKLTLQIYSDNDLEAEYSLDTTTNEGAGSYSFTEYLFEDGLTYQLVLIAESSIGLSATARLNITVQYVSIYLQNGFEPDAIFDEDTGVVTVSLVQQMTPTEMDNNTIAIDEATAAESAEMAEDDDLPTPEATVTTATISRMYLYRITNNSRVLLKTFSSEDMATGDQAYEYVDTYAPVNIDFEYQLLQITSLGEVAISGVMMKFETLWWYVYYGDGNIIKVRWNPSGSGSFKRPEKQQIRYSGREYPVTYDSVANEETYSLNITLFRDIDEGRDTLEQFKDLIKTGGTGIWKSFEGDVYYADFDFTYNSDYTDGISSWECSLNVTRIDVEEDL